MAFDVEISPSALRDIEEAYLWIRERSVRSADAWYNGMVEAIMSLETTPGRCRLAAESESIGEEVRQLMYGRRAGRYRILFGIRALQGSKEGVVRVYRVRHASRDRLQRHDL